MTIIKYLKIYLSS